VGDGVRRVARWADLGVAPFRRQLQVHLFHAAGEAAFAVSLAGSLFFSVSPGAARPRVLLYLVLTLAPFVVVSPFAGPVVDRLRGGYRFVIAASCGLRGLVVLVAATQLDSLLLFPLAFAVLVLGKGYSVAKSALVPTLVTEVRALVTANARLSVFGTTGGALGALCAGAALIVSGGSSSAVLVVAAALYGVGSVRALGLPRTTSRRTDSVVTILETETIALQRVAIGMATLRSAVGFLAFQVAFLLRSQATPAWIFGAVVVAAGVGNLTGTLIAGKLRRLAVEERLLVAALVVPGVVALLGGLQFTRTTAIIAAAALGMGASAGRHAFDSLTQLLAPDADRGRTFAGFEVRFQMAWVFGALVAVVLEPGGVVAFVGLGVALVGVAGFLAFSHPRSENGTPERPMPEELIAIARALHLEGAHAACVVNAAAALRAHGADVRHLRTMEGHERRALRGLTTDDEATRALQLAERVVNGPD
jgi:hypothetical protein